MTTIHSCIFSQPESQAIAQGDAVTYALLQKYVCPGLGQVDVASVQSQFETATTSAAASTAIAFLWRGDSADIVRADQTPILSCEESATPLRCKAALAAIQGHLPRMAMEIEHKTLSFVSHGLGDTEQHPNLEWASYFKQHEPVLDFLDAHPTYSTFLTSNIPSLWVSDIETTATDARLLGTLVLIGNYLKETGWQNEEDLAMQDAVCFDKTHCNDISIQVSKLLLQTAIPNLERVAMARVDNFSILGISLENGGLIYYSNAFEFLSANHRPSWQILSDDLFNVAATLYLKDRPNEVITQSLKVLAMDPTYTPAHFILGYALGDYIHNLFDNPLFKVSSADDIIEMCRKVLVINPNDMHTYNNWGHALLEKGDPNGAIEKFSKATEKHSAWLADAYFGWGLALRNKDDLDGAIDKYRKAIEIFPAFAEAHLKWGLALDNKYDLDGAITHYREAVRIDPKNTRAVKILESALKQKADHKTYYSLKVLLNKF